MTMPAGGDFIPKITEIGPFSSGVGKKSGQFVVKQQVMLNGRVVHLKLRYSGKVGDSTITEDLDKTLRRVAALVDHYDLGKKTQKLEIVGDEVKADGQVEGHFSAANSSPSTGTKWTKALPSRFAPVKGSKISPAEVGKINRIYRAALAMKLEKAVAKAVVPEAGLKVAEKTPLMVREKQNKACAEESRLKDAVVEADKKLAHLKEVIKENVRIGEETEENYRKSLAERQNLYAQWKKSTVREKQNKASAEELRLKDAIKEADKKLAHLKAVIKENVRISEETEENYRKSLAERQNLALFKNPATSLLV